MGGRSPSYEATSSDDGRHPVAQRARSGRAHRSAHLSQQPNSRTAETSAAEPSNESHVGHAHGTVADLSLGTMT